MNFFIDMLAWSIIGITEVIDDKIKKESIEKINKNYVRYYNAINNNKCVVCVLFFLLFLPIIVFLLDIENIWQWTIFSIAVILIILMCLPFIRRISAYQRFLDCLILANIIKETIIDLDCIVLTVSKKNELKKSGIKKASLSAGDFISPVCLTCGNEIWSWVNMNKKYFNAEQQKQLQSIYSKYRDDVKNYIKEIGVFYRGYNRNIVSGIYQEGFVPPIPYKDEDVSFFNHFQLTDMN